MIQRLLALFMLAFAGFAIWDGRRIEAVDRPVSMFDDIGPDRYIVGLGILLAIVGLFLLLDRRPNVPQKSDEEAASGAPTYLALLGALIVYALVMPYLGYTITTLIFMIAVFWLSGVPSILRSVIYGVVTTAVSWWIFVRIADMPMPKGVFSFIPQFL